MKRALYAFAAIAIVVASLAIAHAQEAPIDISLSSVPINPAPGQQVTITAQSYSTDISQANLAWTYNGKSIASNVGQTQITVAAPASGVIGVIGVTATGNGFTSSSATLTLNPGSVDLLWEGADSHVPPFYKGRALPSTGGMIRVVAVPTINAPKNLSYSWSQNDNALQSESGYNKNSIEFQNSALIPTEQIAVTASSGAYSGNSSITIAPGNPNILSYLSTNGFIDYANGSAGSLNTSGTGVVVHFEPYFFSAPNDIVKDLAISYTDNDGNALPPGNAKNELRLSAPTSGNQVQFNVAISTIAYSLQNISQAFTVNFN